MKATQERYTTNYDKKAHQKLQICLVDDIYIERPQPATFASNLVKELVQKQYNKLMRRAGRPHKLTEVRLYTVVTDRHGIVNRGAIDRMTPV